MMTWNGNWTWAWLAMIPMVALTWALIALLVMPSVRHGKDRRPSPVERLDGRLAAGDIGLDDYRSRRAELEDQS